MKSRAASCSNSLRELLIDEESSSMVDNPIGYLYRSASTERSIKKRTNRMNQLCSETLLLEFNLSSTVLRLVFIIRPLFPFHGLCSSKWKRRASSVNYRESSIGIMNWLYRVWTICFTSTEIKCLRIYNSFLCHLFTVVRREMNGFMVERMPVFEPL